MYTGRTLYFWGIPVEEIAKDVKDGKFILKTRGNINNDVKAQIEHERIIEFPLENFRFYDLRRWGKTKAALDAVGRTGFNPAKNNFYPVPLTEIQNN